MSKYKQIQREKLSDKGKDIYDKLKKVSNNFEKTDGKIGEALDKFYNKVEKSAVEKKAEPKKSPAKPKAKKKPTAKPKAKSKPKAKKKAAKKPAYKNVNQGSFAKLASKIMKEEGISYRAAQKKASKIFKEEKTAKRKSKKDEFSKMLTHFKKKYKGKGLSGTTVDVDAELPAKPVGKRISKNNKVYYEYRDNRTDQKQPQPSSKPRLAKGGTTKGQTLAENFNMKDEVQNVEFWKNDVIVKDKQGKVKRIDLDKGERISLNAKGGEVEVGDWVAHKKGDAYGRGQVYKIDSLGVYLKDKYGNESHKMYQARNLKHKGKPRYAKGGVLKHFIGDEGMFKGEEFRIKSHESFPNRYTIKELDKDGKEIGREYTINQKDFESNFSKFDKGGKVKRDWSNYYEDGGMVASYDVDAPFGTYAKGGTIMSESMQERLIDKNGERKIDRESIKVLTNYVNSLQQTKDKYLNNGEYTDSRKKLHKDIIAKFKDGVVCINDNKPIAILMGGSPASGKSTFLRKYAPYLLKDEILRIDADEVRSMLPEYEGWNASQTHLETKDIVNTLLSDRTIGLPCETDIIYDGTMNSNKSYLPLIKVLRKLGYKIFIVYIDKVPKDVIVDRALKRYGKSGRFVPLEVIDDFFDKGKDALNEIKKKVDGYMIVDGSGGDYTVIEEGGMKLPKTRKYGQIGTPMKKKKKLEFGGDITQNFDVRSPLGTYAKGGKVEEKYEKFKHELITRIQEDIDKSKERADAHKQEENKEALAFEKGHQYALTTTLFDINDLDYDFYNKYAKGGDVPNELEDAIKEFENRVKKQGRITNARDEAHLKRLKREKIKYANRNEASQVFVLQDDDFGNEIFRGIDELNEYLKEFNEGYGENYKTYKDFNEGEENQGRYIERSFAKGGEIPKDWKHKEDFKHNGNTYKIYLNTWNDTYVATFKGRVAPSFSSLKEVKEYIKKGRLNYAKGGKVRRKRRR